MKKTYILSYVIIMFVLLSGTANADISSTTTVNRIADLKQKILDIKTEALQERTALKDQIASTTVEIKNQREDLKNTIETRIGKRLDAQKLKVTGPFENAIQNLTDLLSRIESRMTKMEENNIDISSSIVLFDTAKSKVDIANTELTNLANLLSDLPAATTSTTTNIEKRTQLQKIKTQVASTKALILDARKSIIDVINSLKLNLSKNTNSTSTNN